tara:strand:+ start:3580 stop:4491 length:912 start_codon:yes stop_codon:yes gene_type:complete
MSEQIPWVEKYRPRKINNIVLNEYNEIILKNILKNRYFPNLLFYGAPGTGKTTTMINLISSYQSGDTVKKGLTIHLNASDDRGIDVIRQQISVFINSDGLFNKGIKFIILDEVDYMTKNAQLGLKYLIENSNKNVRYCLICNYISKIDISLQNRFIKLKFNRLPNEDVIRLLKDITIKENIVMEDEELKSLQVYFDSDIRSMINYIQVNRNNNKIEILNNKIINSMLSDVKLHNVDEKVNELSKRYNVDKYGIIKQYIYYMIKNKYKITGVLLDKLESIFRNIDTSNNNNIIYILSKLLSLED